MTEPRLIDLDGFNVIVRGRDALYIANRNDVYVGRSLCLYGEYCADEFSLLQALAKPGSIIAEVGANCGAHTVRLAKAVGTTGRVVAIEPQPPMFQALAGTIALNNLMNVDCYPYAIGAQSGRIYLPQIDYRRENNFGGLALGAAGTQGLPVPLKTLDEAFLLPRLDLLKIDVEGMELEVLHGGAETIKTMQPVIYLENDRRDRSRMILEWLTDAGYRMWWHFPRLFSAGNYFGNSENVFGETCSINVLAVPKAVSVEIGLPPVKGPDDFPQTTIDGPPS